jgi:uncharacterized protein YraI
MLAMRYSLMLALLLAAPLFAATAATPYIAKVTGDSVRVRTGAGTAHPPIHVLALGEEVTVISAQDGWALIRLPAGAPCWLAAEFVAEAEDGSSYTVTGDNVNLRASPDTRYFPIGQVKQGQVLQVCLDGRTGKGMAENGFVRVIPPPQARGAVAVEFLEHLRAAEIEEPEITAAPPVAPAPVAEAQAAKPLARPKAEREPTAEELADERRTFVELERLLADELKKPAAQVDLTYVRRMFEQFQQYALDETIRESSSTYIQRIDNTVKLIEAESAKLEADAARRRVELQRIRDEALERREEIKEEPKGPIEYLWTGTVGSHGRTARTPASHRLFDEDGKVLYDLRWDGGNLARLMGSRVGIVGTVREYEGWSTPVIVIERIDIIEDGEVK